MPLLQDVLGSMKSSGPALYSPGTLLSNGRYKIERRLNKGATAIVYAATDKQTGRQVALKVVQCGTNKVPVSVVRREVTLSSSVAHENMVQLLDVFAEGTELIIVWELIAGPDLLELLNEAHGRMNEAAAAFYFVQLLRGVLHMHAMGYCHRDIKPENCMVDRATQRLKLIDFGLSKHLESVATLGVGTPDYMPPEMVRSHIKSQRPQPQSLGGARVGPAMPLPAANGLAQQRQQPPYDAKKVDAWAMGVLLYLLVTGTYPFEDPAQPNNLAATILNVQAGRCRPLPREISRGCRDVIAGLLNPDPEKRTSLEALAHTDWLTRSAAAHVAQLGPLASRFDPTNPAWVLPTNFTAAAAPSFTQEPPVYTTPAAAAAAAGSSSGGGPALTTPAAAADAADSRQLRDQQQQQQVTSVGQKHTDTTEYMDMDDPPSVQAVPWPSNPPEAAAAALPAMQEDKSAEVELAVNGAPTPAAAAAAAGAPAGGGLANRKGMSWLPEFMRRCI